MRQVVLDTETTGLSTAQGHRIIEIGCVEMVNRRLTGREYHRFVNPERQIDDGAERVHGISNADLEGQPLFRDIVEEFLSFIRGSELVIHNAEFDVGFIENELQLMRYEQPKVTTHASVLDTLSMARRMHPGQRNSLDALCKRYAVDASRRSVHGALIDAELLARVYLAMTGGQAALVLDDGHQKSVDEVQDSDARQRPDGLTLRVVAAHKDELAAHEEILQKIEATTVPIYRDMELPDAQKSG